MRRGILIIIFFLMCGWAREVLAAGVAPSVIEVNSDRGTVSRQEITIINTNNAAETYYLSTVKFTAWGDESGTPKFIPPTVDHSGLADWIALENSSIVIPAKSFAQIPFSVVVPNDALAGSYFAAITVSKNQIKTATKNTSEVQDETASLILLTVNGENKTSGALLDFQINQIDTDQIFGTYKYRIQNQGNIYFAPKTEIVFTDIFGRKLLVVDGNENGGRILPSATRLYEGIYGQESNTSFWSTLKKQFSVLATGPITASLKISINNNTLPLTAATTFWYFPWSMFLVLIVVIGLLVGFYGLLKKVRR